MNPSLLIKEKALELGYSRVGLTSADDFEPFLEILESRGAEYDFHRLNPLNPLAGARPRTLMPEARSIVVLALDYAQNAFPQELTPLIARPYLARAYMPLPDSLNGLRLKAMVDFLRELGYRVRDDLMIPARWAAARSGVATFGRNTFACADGLGSFIIIYTLVLDGELTYDQPTLENKCPDKCRACLDACPTKALYEPFKINPRLCLAFNAWKTQKGMPGVDSAQIPMEVRPLMDRHVHGCDICQEACPRNQKKLKAVLPEDEFLTRIAPDMTLTNLLNMPEGFFERRVRPIMHNYIKEPKYFQRNAAVALGNSGDREAVDQLAGAMANSEALVRAHAAWALGRLGGAKAGRALEKSLKMENDPEVKGEIRAALTGLAG